MQTIQNVAVFRTLVESVKICLLLKSTHVHLLIMLLHKLLKNTPYMPGYLCSIFNLLNYRTNHSANFCSHMQENASLSATCTILSTGNLPIKGSKALAR